MIVIHAEFPIDPAKQDEALDLFEEIVEHSRAEDGVVDYHATTDISNPNVVRFFEEYEDAAAFEAHSQTEHTARLEEALPDLLVGEPTVRRFEVDAASDLDL